MSSRTKAQKPLSCPKAIREVGELASVHGDGHVKGKKKILCFVGELMHSYFHIRLDLHN